MASLTTELDLCIEIELAKRRLYREHGFNSAKAYNDFRKEVYAKLEPGFELTRDGFTITVGERIHMARKLTYTGEGLTVTTPELIFKQTK